jgi:hypothetical protein
MADCIYLRDRIRIDTALNTEITAEIAAGHLTTDGTLLLAAREIVHEPGYRLALPSYRIVVAADTYRCDGGSIDVSGEPAGLRQSDVMSVSVGTRPVTR